MKAVLKRVCAFALAALLLASLCVTLAGCKKSDDNKPDTTPEPTKDTASYATEPPQTDGMNRVVFYWYNETGDYSKCDMWIWFPGADGHGYLFTPCEYGARVELDVPRDVTEVGFIVRRECSSPGGSSWGDAEKDYDGDRFAAVTGERTEIYLKPGDGNIYLSSDGGKTLYQDKVLNMAGLISPNEIKYSVTPAAKIESLDMIKVTVDGREVAVTGLSSLNNEVKFGVITLAEPLDVSKPGTLSIEGFGECPVIPTDIFDSEAFIEQYAYDGELGAIVSDPVGFVDFRLWAPTASEVTLNLYEAGDSEDAIERITMNGEFGSGVWEVSLECAPGTYYTYTVTTALGTKEIVDPYAKAVGVNGDRGMVVDLASTDPEGWENDTFYSGVSAYNEAVIWEVHVRDFSNRIEGCENPGKYLAFTETGLKNSAGEPVGIDYLKQLGITHVHLQPVYDYATVDESSDAPQFNWGYDPKNYNAPEGSYSTDPYHGEVRIKEFKQMVMALHDAGIGVIMDVVYNHTYSADSNFSAAVPYYYYRYDGLGALSNGSGCGNETASERVMFRKFIVDSVSYWAAEYHLDGFRFDLMALHDVATMQAVEEAVHAINPNALIYGEGWTGGTTPLRDNVQANQKNIGQIHATGEGIGAVSVFNDSIRDGLKGSVFDAKDKGYISGKLGKGVAENVAFGIAGGKKTALSTWGVENSAVINYMSCHDNNTLFDKLEISCPDASLEERLQMQRFGASIVLISKGTPFFLAGEEMLRTKGGDSNSYNSSDEVNNIDWEALAPGSDALLMSEFYRELIAMRKANGFFTKAEVEYTVNDDSSIEVIWSMDGREAARGFINPLETPRDFTANGSYGVLFDGSAPRTEPAGTVSGSVAVPARSVVVLIPNN